MTTLTDALAKAPNPLAATTASESDGATGLVDVPALHAVARQALVQGCERARRGHSQVFALVGEAGLGKSHLLLWLRQRLTLRGDPLTYFISMPALPDLAQPFRHALRQLVGALCRRELAGTPPEPTDPSSLLDRPIDRLLWGALFSQTCDLLDAARVGMYQGPATLLKLLGPMCSDAGRRRSLAEFAAAAQKVWGQVEPGLRSYLLSLPTEMSIDSAARAVLLQFPYADRRALCTAWLAGEELSQKDRERLSAKQVINNENAAKYVLCSVVRLLTAPPGAQLVLCYDQTQQLGEQLGQPGIQAMAEVVAALHSCGGSTLQVLSLLPTSFSQLYEKPARSAPTQGPSRHLDQTVRLAPVGVELLRELVAARLDVGLAEADQRPSPLYPFTEAELDLSRWPQEANSPRSALEVFAQRYAQRRSELVPGASSGRHAVSSPDQRRPAGSRAKDAPSLTDVDRRRRSADSPVLDFLSEEVTGDATAATPGAPGASSGARPRSLTHPDESGATAASGKSNMSRVGQPFVADSSPTLQAVPKAAIAAGMVPTTVKAREIKVSPSVIADSSPTQRAVSDDVMGKVRGAATASKRSPDPPRELKQPPAVASRAVSMSSEDVLMGRLGRPAKAADKAADAAAPEKAADKGADKSTARAGASVSAKNADSDLGLTKRTPASAVPREEADSNPTLKRGPDESLLKATRELSRPAIAPKPAESPAKPAPTPSPSAKPADESLLKASREPSRPLSSQPARTAAPSGESGVVGRPTPTLAPQPALISASQPSRSPAKPAVSAKPVTVAAAAKPAAPEAAPVAKPAPVPVPVAKPAAAEAAVSNVPDPLPPSAESPSMGWLAMANDDPLANALKKADAKETKAQSSQAPAALSEPPRPAPLPPPARPQNPSAPPKAGPAAVARAAEPAAKAPAARTASTQPPAAKSQLSTPLAASKLDAASAVAAAMSSRPPAGAKSGPIPAVAPMPEDNAPTELPPSAESPSMGWLAMASGSSQLDDAIAASGLAPAAKEQPPAPTESAPSASDKSDKSESGPTKARAARPVRGNMGGVVVVNPATVRPSEVTPTEPVEPVRAPARSTQARMPAIQLRTAQSVSPQQVLAALPESGMMEDWQLAQELGLPLDSLEKILLALEDDGQVRLMAMGDGQRMVVRID